MKSWYFYNYIPKGSFTFLFELDPDPPREFLLDPDLDPQKMPADPKHGI